MKAGQSISVFTFSVRADADVYPVTEISNYTIENKSFNDNLSQITFWGIIQTILLIITVLISVYKPWKCKGK
jgi:uncharacterized membrane protein